VEEGFILVGEQARQAADGRLQLAGWVGVLAVAFVIYVALDLAYDLSRVSAAAHGDRRTFVGFVRALGHALRHPLRLAPLWLFFSLLSAGLAVAYVLTRAAVTPAHGGHLALLLLAQQVVFLLLAFLKVGLWGAEIAYYQAVGEPRWCGRRARLRAGQTSETRRSTGDRQRRSSQGWKVTTSEGSPPPADRTTPAISTVPE
jgi:branched-subunit amino acid ABC-type transport system permease component